VLPFLILVFVDAHDAATPLPDTLARAAEEALGAQVAVSTRPLADDAPAAALVDAGRAGHAAIAAHLLWLDDQHVHARLDVVAVDGSFSRTSTVVFDAADPLPERGRAIGLVLAALVAPERQKLAESAPTVRAPRATVAVAAVPTPAPTPVRRFALDAAAECGWAIAGAGSGVGGALGLRWHPTRRLGLRVGAQGRFGEVARAQATALDLAAAAGIVLFAVAPADDRHLALALRIEGLLLYESLSHLSEDDSARIREGRFLPGGLGLVELHWALSPTLALAIAGGVEVAFGRTDIFVHQQKVADLAPLRVLAQAGLVARF
jgi:hypothetical protein